MQLIIVDAYPGFGYFNEICVEDSQEREKKIVELKDRIQSRRDQLQKKGRKIAKRKIDT